GHRRGGGLERWRSSPGQYSEIRSQKTECRGLVPACARLRKRKAEVGQDTAGGGRQQQVAEFARFGRVMQDDASLFERRVERLREVQVVPLPTEVWRKHQRQSDDPRIGRAALHELQRLRDVLSKHQFWLERVIKALCAQRSLGGASIRGVCRVGDGEALQAHVLERGGGIER